MTLRVFNQRFLEPGSMWLMILGMVALVQPWVGLLHQYSVTIMLVGLVGFNVAAHIPAPEQRSEAGDEALGGAAGRVTGPDHG